MPARRPDRRSIAIALAIAALAIGAGCTPIDEAQDAVGIIARGCPPGDSNGSGVPIAPRVVLTAAHVVKGGGEIVVTNGSRTTTGEIVAFDSEMDLALIEVERPIGGVFRLGGDDVDDGAEGVAYVMRDGEIVTLPVIVRRRITLRTEDIYIDGLYERPAWELDADTESGDSGGPVVVDGEVIGVLSLRSDSFDSRAYAVDPVRGGERIREQRATGELGPDVDLRRCYTP